LAALRIIYPEHNWNDVEFARKSGYWNDIANQRARLDTLAVTFHIQKPEDWYNVPVHKVLQSGAWFIKTNYKGSLIRGI
jgi:hypothetical protein